VTGSNNYLWDAYGRNVLNGSNDSLTLLLDSNVAGNNDTVTQGDNAIVIGDDLVLHVGHLYGLPADKRTFYGSPPPLPNPNPPFPGRGAFACAPGNDLVVCSALGDLYYSSGQAWQDYTSRAHWPSPAAGIPTDYSDLAGLSCTNGVLDHLCVPDHTCFCMMLTSFLQ